MRGDLMAVYRFARYVDDLGDELGDELGDDGSRVPSARTVELRLAALDTVDADLDRLEQGASPRLAPVAGLAGVVARGVDVADLRSLVEANRQDQVVTAYPTYDDLLAYCRLSADPVGHLVLAVFGVTTPERRRLSDDVCTALQLVEHWQDVREDAARGRVYLPQEDLARFGCRTEDLAAPYAGEALRALVAFETDRAAALLRSGPPLVRSLSGAARVAVAGFVAGGLATVRALRRADHDVLRATPRPRRADVLALSARLLAPRWLPALDTAPASAMTPESMTSGRTVR